MRCRREATLDTSVLLSLRTLATIVYGVTGGVIDRDRSQYPVIRLPFEKDDGPLQCRGALCGTTKFRPTWK